MKLGCKSEDKRFFPGSLLVNKYIFSMYISNASIYKTRTVDNVVSVETICL